MKPPPLLALVMAGLGLVLEACVSHITGSYDLSRPQVTSIRTTLSSRACVGPQEALPVIPLPLQIVRLPGTFTLPSMVTIGANSAAARDVATLLAAQIRPLGIRAAPGDFGARATIRIDDVPAAGLGPEGYRLTVEETGINISANGGAGLFYGVQTLEQITSRNGHPGCAIPYVRNVDSPEYAWRGVHLDSAAISSPSRS